MRLHTKIQLVVIPLVVIPLLLLGWLAYQQLKQTVGERTSGQMHTLMDQMNENFQFQMDVARANITLFSNSTLMRTYAVNEDEEERYLLMMPSLLKLFSSYLRAYPQYYEIRFLLPDGYEDVRATLTNIPNATDEEGDTPLFKTLANSPDVISSHVLINPDNGELSVQVGRKLDIINAATDDPVETRSTLRGYLVVTMSLDFLSKQIVGSQIGKTGQVFVIDNQGQIVIHRDTSRVGQQLDPGLYSKLASSDHSHSFKGFFGEEQALFDSRKLHENLVLVGMLPESEMSRETRSLGTIVALIIFLTILVTVVSLILTMRHLIVRPLKSVIRAVEDISKGRLNTIINLSTSDELGQLASRFKSMGKSLKLSRDKIERLAYHDSLTGLPNRLMFREYLETMIAMARRENKKMAVLFLDLDNFKRVNDTLGHHVGDRLLREMATRLMSILRVEDFVYQDTNKEISQVLARLGGDEFIILLPNVKGSYDAAKVAGRILDVMRKPFCFDGHELFNGASIGITLFPNDGTEVNDLIKRADVAMYHAKEQGRNNFQFYSPSYNQATRKSLSLESRLRRALDKDQFELYYQPQVNAQTSEIAGFEALIRWHDPKQGIVMPDQFIPLAEDSGLILPIGEWVLGEACRQAEAWHSAGLARVFMSVNVSVIQLLRQDFSDLVDRVISASSLEHRYLELELTESVLLKVQQEVLAQLHKVKDKGVEISLDDFGTGFSSLSRLQELPIGKLKVDRRFVQDMLTNKQDAAIVSAILNIVESLGLSATAEGVETQEQVYWLQRNGCDLLQGDWFSRPLTAQDATALLSAEG